MAGISIIAGSPPFYRESLSDMIRRSETAATKGCRFCCRSSFYYRLLLARQIPIFCASLISSSRNCGWAMEISFSALCQVDNPFRFTFPYSVTTKWVLVLVSVTMEPESSTGRIRDFRFPALSVKVEEQQIKLFPPLDR